KLSRASSSMPLLAPIVKIDHVPYLDGGLADSLPLNRAVQLGNPKMVFVLTRNPGYRKQPISKGLADLYRRSYKKYPKLVETLRRRSYCYNRTMDKIEELEEAGKIFVIRPQVKAISKLEQNYDVLLDFYQHGYHLMEKQYQNLLHYLDN
ncbi:MAG: DUF6363 domain-containing protein, partial [Lachnospiraceae bacterium]